MFVRVLQIIAATLYIVAAIGTVAYNELSFFWLAPVLAPAIYFIFTLPNISVPSGPYLPPQPIDRTYINVRIEELKSGPPHRNKTQYIDSVSRGIPYSNERIDYLEFPDRLVLCEPLRPIEAAMRAARLPMDNPRPGQVEVGALLRKKPIEAHFHPDPCVVFGLGPGVDNHAPDINVIRCTLCGHSIEENGYNNTPWPAA